MLEFFSVYENAWQPPQMNDEDILYALVDGLPDDLEPDGDYLLITQTEPFIDSVYVHFTNKDSLESMYKKRFVFKDGFRWSHEDEELFSNRILANSRIRFSYVIDEIYRYYSETYPDWKLQRYYTKPMRMLDHIYHCMRRGTAKEMLYKAGLDEFAANIDELDELNLLSSKPSDIYGGVSMRVLRALNCHDGSILMSSTVKRAFVKELQMKFPEIFKEKLNDAQCRYLSFLIDGDLTLDEVGRLFNARRMDLMMIWAPSQFEMFLQKEKVNRQAILDSKEIVKIDPIYRDYVGKLDFDDTFRIYDKLQSLRYYLLVKREQYDKDFRRSNRKRDPEWQERDKGYVVRYPQTINDFCRESIFMSNCLLTYVDAYVNNDTNILFMRKTDDYNAPFITLEVFKGELMQAYKRFNEECSTEEIEWILGYCDRHYINPGVYTTNEDV